MRITGAWQWRLSPTRLRSGACERAMTRDGTVGRSDATETNLALHRDIDPVRMMRTRFADPIRASSLLGLHQQAGHMTASDRWRASKYLLPGGGHPHMRRSFPWYCRYIGRSSP